MSRHTHTLPAGTFAIEHHAYCGMSWTVEANLERADARQTLAALLRRRRRTGHPVSRLSRRAELPVFECGEPEGCALVPDTAGTVEMVEETVPAYACFTCGDILPVDTACTCQDPPEEEETDDDDEDPADCPECERSHGPHYTGPCEHEE